MRGNIYQETVYMMRSYFNFHVSIEVLLIFQKKLELLHCVFSSGRPKSNKILNKKNKKYFGPYKN